MESIFLQLWGGLWYLSAKIFLLKAEGIREGRWKNIGWISYLIGVPAWLIILWVQENWIAFAVEGGGVPAMILGLSNLKPKWAISSIWILTITLIFLSVFYSISQTNHVTTNQLLEFGVTIGFLFGTYLLAVKNRSGWLFFMLMNISMAILMALSSKWIFTTLQGISLIIAFMGYRKACGEDILLHLENFFKSHRDNLRKRRIKKKLQSNKYWKITDKELGQLLINYFNCAPTTSGLCQMLPIIECGFDLIINHNVPMGWDGAPNLEIATPDCLEKLKGDEKGFTLDLYDTTSDRRKYSEESKSGYAKGFICSIKFGLKDSTTKKYQIGDWYRYSILIQTPLGSLILGFEHPNSRGDKCEIIFGF